MSRHLVPTTLVGGLLIASVFAGNTAFASIPTPPGFQQGADFLGTWCAQGDPYKRASISRNGIFLSVTNENGNTATGQLQGSNRISVPMWQFVTGILGNNGRRIDWSNGTFWARCRSGHRRGGRGRYPPYEIRLAGTWYAHGNRTLVCSISQHGGDLELRNESGHRAVGSFTGKYDIRTNWDGRIIRGWISRDGDRIDWDNGTYWIRAAVFR